MPISDLDLNILAALTIKHGFGGCYDNDQKEAVRDFYLQYAAAHAFKPDIVRVPEVFSVNLATLLPVQKIEAILAYQDESCQHPTWEQSNAKIVTDKLLRAVCRELEGYGAPKPTVQDPSIFSQLKQIQTRL